MGNRTFLYLTDSLPGAGGTPEPAITHLAAEGSGDLPPLWYALFSAALPGPAQDFQQVFMPSLFGGIYAERKLAEQRMFALLDFIATNPKLRNPDALREHTARLREALAPLEGAAYSADLNEWLSFDDDGSEPEATLDRFAQKCARRWARTEKAIEQGDHATITDLYDFDLRDVAGGLGFEFWSIARFPRRRF